MRSLRQAGTVQVAALALLLFAGAFSIVVNQRSRGAVPLVTSGALQAPPSAALGVPSKTEAAIETLQERLRTQPSNVDAAAQLGAAYLQRAREVGDPTYYAKAQQVLDAAQRTNKQNLELLIGQGALALARHDFRGALALGQQAQRIEPSVARVYGVIGDAQIELGMYDAAVQTIQAMVDLRPDLSSYARVAYLRELHGDVSGAIEALEQAISAGGSTSEATEWVRVQLGNLHFGQGDLAAAEREYRRSLTALPDYVPAQAGMARIAVAQRNYPRAIALYHKVTERMPLPEYVIALGDVYARQGDQARAQEQYALVQVIDKLLASNGVNTDMETALFMADHTIDLPGSLEKARAAYAARPSVNGADALAWTLYRSGKAAEAQRYAAEALKLGTQDALKLFHAGMIAKSLGDTAAARMYLGQALALNPHFSPLFADEAAQALAQLGGAAQAQGST